MPRASLVNVNTPPPAGVSPVSSVSLIPQGSGDHEQLIFTVRIHSNDFPEGQQAQAFALIGSLCGVPLNRIDCFHPRGHHQKLPREQLWLICSLAVTQGSELQDMIGHQRMLMTRLGRGCPKCSGQEAWISGEPERQSRRHVHTSRYLCPRRTRKLFGGQMAAM